MAVGVLMQMDKLTERQIGMFLQRLRHRRGSSRHNHKGDPQPRARPLHGRMLIGGGDQGVEYVRARAGRFTLGAWRQRKSHLDQVNAQGIIGTRFQPSLSACQRGRAPDRADWTCVAEAPRRGRTRVRLAARDSRSRVPEGQGRCRAALCYMLQHVHVHAHAHAHVHVHVHVSYIYMLPIVHLSDDTLAEVFFHLHGFHAVPRFAGMRPGRVFKMGELGGCGVVFT